MTDTLTRIRDIALLLPGTTEGEAGFLVDGKPFVRFNPDTSALHLCIADKGWSEIPIPADSDWTLIEDQIARSWELVAPAELLEAGGR